MAKTAIIGGGAAGFFLAVCLGEMVPGMDITILEGSRRVLAKVKVSGGGRCNCTNSFAHVTDLAAVYPRGHRLLKRLFKLFGPQDAYRWFEQHGVRLVTQDDGCVFPASQDSQTIINCLLREARRHRTDIRTGVRINTLKDLDGYDFVAVCTGGSPRAEAFRWLADAGHEIVPPVPSLFSLSIKEPPFCNLMGLVVEEASAMIPGTKLRANGPLLITHWGASGPAILKLSSYAARHLNENDYKVPLSINWTGRKEDEVIGILQDIKQTYPQRQLPSMRPCGLPARLWEYLLRGNQNRWGSLSQKDINRLANTLTNDIYQTSGRAPFRDEFVTCGGVALGNVAPATLESRQRHNLFFAGEVLDIDGITGGFNFQAAWTTAYAVAAAIKGKCESEKAATKPSAQL